MSMKEREKSPQCVLTGEYSVECPDGTVLVPTIANGFSGIATNTFAKDSKRDLKKP